MEIMIDLNIILDCMQKREHFFEESKEILDYCAKRRIKGYISVNCASTLYYLLHKELHSKKKTYEVMSHLFSIVSPTPVLGADALDALKHTPKDYEDCLMALSCRWLNIDGIVTRNKDDFDGFGIKTYTPSELISMINS